MLLCHKQGPYSGKATDSVLLSCQYTIYRHVSFRKMHDRIGHLAISQIWVVGLQTKRLYTDTSMSCIFRKKY